MIVSYVLLKQVLNAWELSFLAHGLGFNLYWTYVQLLEVTGQENRNQLLTSDTLEEMKR